MINGNSVSPTAPTPPSPQIPYSRSFHLHVLQYTSLKDRDFYFPIQNQ